MKCRQITIKIQTGNDSFADNPRRELARILRRAADQLGQGVGPSFLLVDSNGNNVGQLTAQPAGANIP